MNTGKKEEKWNLKLAAFFSTPPDKALKNVECVHKGTTKHLYDLVDLPELLDKSEVKTAVEFASTMSSDNFLDGLEALDGIQIDFSDQGPNPTFVHPLSAESFEFLQKEKPIKSGAYDQKITQTLDLHNRTPKEKFFTVWRQLPSVLDVFQNYPAEPWMPFTTAWDQADVTSAFTTTKQDIALFSFSIGPVHDFIKNARKTKDLWSGSHLLSYLCFNAMLPIIESYGPDSIVFPYLREQPFLDRWLEQHTPVSPSYQPEDLAVSSLPNTFMAIIPQDAIEDLKSGIEDRIKEVREELAKRTLEYFKSLGGAVDNYLEDIWERETKFMFDLTFQSITFPSPVRSRKDVKDWFEELKNAGLSQNLVEKYAKWIQTSSEGGTQQERGFNIKSVNAATLYGLYSELLGMMLGQRGDQFEEMIEPEEVGSEKGGRCSNCGTRNPLRTREYEEKPKKYWEKMREEHPKLRTIFRDNERLCAVCLIKRLYPRYMKEKFNTKEVRLPSVSSIATKDFLEKFQEVYQEDKSEEKDKSAAIEFLESYNKYIGKSIGKKVLGNEIKEYFDGELLYQSSLTQKYIKDHFGCQIDKETIQNDLREPLNQLYEEIYGEVRKPPKYYAILRIDGDRMGDKLNGKHLPLLKKFTHESITDILEKNGNAQDLADFLSSTRILTPSVHIAISRTLKNFSLHHVPRIIRENQGVLIYVGGDDVLALLPASKALQTARKLNKVFKKSFDANNRLLMGAESSMSAGIVYSHYKYPLYYAMEESRKAMRTAKDGPYDREAFLLKMIKSSGGINAGGGDWRSAPHLEKIIEAIKKGILSSQFIYRLMAEARKLGKPDGENNEKIAEKEKNMLIDLVEYLLTRHITIEGNNDDNDAKKEKIEELRSQFEEILSHFQEETEVTQPLLEVSRMIKILYDSRVSE